MFSKHTFDFMHIFQSKLSLVKLLIIETSCFSDILGKITWKAYTGNINFKCQSFILNITPCSLSSASVQAFVHCIPGDSIVTVDINNFGQPLRSHGGP